MSEAAGPERKSVGPLSVGEGNGAAHCGQKTYFFLRRNIAPAPSARAIIEAGSGTG